MKQQQKTRLSSRQASKQNRHINNERRQLNMLLGTITLLDSTEHSPCFSKAGSEEGLRLNGCIKGVCTKNKARLLQSRHQEQDSYKAYHCRSQAGWVAAGRGGHWPGLLQCRGQRPIVAGLATRAAPASLPLGRSPGSDPAMHVSDCSRRQQSFALYVHIYKVMYSWTAWMALRALHQRVLYT